MVGTLIHHDTGERQFARGLMNALQPALGVGRGGSGGIPFGATADANQRQAGENAAQGKPLISAAITQWEGQISLYDPARGAPCYECVFPVRPAAGMVPSCAEAGVISPLPGVIGAMMAVEAVKQITGAGQALAGRLMIYDALYAETRVIKIKPRADCPICGAAGS